MADDPNQSADVKAPKWLALDDLLGVGGMGKVYRATDHRSGDVVAVKTLTNFVGKELLCLKNEFRSFADVVHPNLINQHELVEHEGQWFLLMELLEGRELLYDLRDQDPPKRLHAPISSLSGNALGSNKVDARGTAGTSPATEEQPDRTRTVAVKIEPQVEPAPPPKKPDAVRRVLTPAELKRAIPVLRQVAFAIDAIHRSGFLHRDIKPSNVLVTYEGRAVLLDFGIAVAKQTAKIEAGLNGVVVGTPAYLAPELHRGDAATTSSDWFSFGVMLFEALTGGRPWPASASFRTKSESRPPRVTHFAPGISEPLADLVDGLLGPEPGQRPTFTDIITTLGGQREPALAGQSESGQTRTSLVVGRAEERKKLRALAAQARRAPTSIFIRGRSGVGKTVLLGEFLSELEAGGALVLAGRCYEQEIVPYKTVDKLVDTLTSELDRHPEWVAELTPQDVVALTRAFPVLRAVFQVTDRQAKAAGDDSADLQRRAIAALTEVMQRLAKKQTLVVCVDDLQWGDVVGAQVLVRLAKPGGPPVLVIGGFRAEDSSSPAIVALGELFKRETGHAADVMTIEPLSAAESRELAESIAGETGIKDPAMVEWALSESEGQPFFLQQLLFAAAKDPELAKPKLGHGLQDVIAMRIAQLPGDVRKLLEVVCLAGSMVPLEVATQASGLPRTARLLQQLRSGHFIRTASTDGKEAVDTYHDKFREVVSARIEPERSKEVHAGLMKGWLSQTGAGAGRLFAMANHARRAGDLVAPGEAFAVLRDAAAEARASFDSARAREFLLGAQTVGASQGEALSVALENALGEACLAVDDVEGAKAAFDRVIAQNPAPPVRAAAHTGLSRLSMVSLQTREAFSQTGQALEALGLPAVEASSLSVLKTLGAFLLALVQARFRPSKPKETDSEAARLYSMAGFSGYFLFDRRLVLVGMLRGYPPISRISGSASAAEWFAISSIVASVAKLKGLTQFMLKKAHTIAATLHDPGTQAFVSGFEALAVDLSGDILGGERLGLAASENGARHEVSSYMTLISGITWNTLMRGQVGKALSLLNHALSRMDATGESLIARGHTFRSYYGPLFALTGEPQSGRDFLDSYGAFLNKNAPDDVFRQLLLLGQEALYQVLTGANDSVLDTCFEREDAYGVSVSSYVQTLRQIKLARALHRGDQLVRNPRNKVAMTDARKTVAILKKFGAYETTVLHRQLLEAKIAWATGASPIELLDSIRSRADAIQAPWLAVEAMMTEAAWQRASGHAAKADELQRALETAATEAGLHGLIARSRRFAQRPN